MPTSAGAFNERLDFLSSPEDLARSSVPIHLILSAFLRESHTFQLYHEVISTRGAAGRFLPFECSASDTHRVHDLFACVRAGTAIASVMVSDPFKTIVAGMVDELSQRAARTGAVNLVTLRGRSLYGDNLDGLAFNTGTRGIEGFSLGSDSVLFLGCGGVTSAVALENVMTISHFGLCDVEEPKAVALYERIIAQRSNAQITIVPATANRNLADYEVLYNGTGLGKFPHLDGTPLADNDATGGARYFVDAIYTPEKTAFLAQGETRGAATINGLSHMLASTALHCSIICDQPVTVIDVLGAYQRLHRL